MKKEGRELVKDAVRDAKSLKEAALEAAKNEIIEQMAPELKVLLEKSIKNALRTESTDRSGDQGSQYYSPASRQKQAKWEEGKDKGEEMDDQKSKEGEELDLESLSGFFPQISEAEPEPGDDEALEAAGQGLGGIPTLGEEEEGEDLPVDEFLQHEAKKAKDDEEEEEKEEMDEEIEISEAELRKVYEAALQTEVQVKKGFSDMSKSGELDEVDPAAGLADIKKGEAGWETKAALPPAKQDHTVKEMIQRGLAENKQLRTENSNLKKMVQTLGGKLHEVNLFNAKVLHVNRILNQNGRLTKEQKQVVLESIDKAKSIGEVKMVFETIVSSFNAAAQLHEGKNPRKPAANAQRARTSGSPNQKVLRESVDRASNTSFDRLKKLAGLVK